MKKLIAFAVLAAALSSCAPGGRFAGFNNCSADGSVVLFEYPNKAGSYEGIGNGPCGQKR